MPFRPYLRGLLQAERFADRQAEIDQAERIRLGVQLSLARRAERMTRRTLYSTYGREVQAAPVAPPSKEAAE